MEWLNYHHLLYFWVVAREGTIGRACAQLRLAQPTVSAQIRALEQSLGEELFERTGRTLRLTEMGQVVFRYADDIFSVGRELLDTVRKRPTGRPIRFIVGIADVVPRLAAHRLLAPALALPQPVRLICRQDHADRLLAELSVHNLDLVISDAPVGPHASIKAFNHLLGECGVSFFAVARLARRLRRGFPASLDGAPMLLPADGTVLRRSIDQWFDEQGVRPHAVGEFGDSSLMKVFGQEGAGVFAAPQVMTAEVCRQYRVACVGTTDTVRERFYAISVDRKLQHPAVVAVTQGARRGTFG